MKTNILFFLCVILLLSSTAVTWYTFDVPKPKWQPFIWANTLANNHNKISDCYGFIVDNNIQQFSQACDITTLIVIENSIINEYNKQHAKHPGSTRLEFLQLYYDHNNAVTISSHMEHQLQFNMTLMILMISETIINSKKQRTNNADFQRIPTRTTN